VRWLSVGAQHYDDHHHAHNEGDDERQAYAGQGPRKGAYEFRHEKRLCQRFLSKWPHAEFDQPSREVGTLRHKIEHPRICIFVHHNMWF
jgi:hypothetical protein